MFWKFILFTFFLFMSILHFYQDFIYLNIRPILSLLGGTSIVGVPSLLLYYDQLILEYWKESDPNSGWVHCSFSQGKNRRQYLKAYKDENNKTRYEPI